jgi:hypothetical protein
MPIGDTVLLEFDVSRRDRFDRLLAYVWWHRESVNWRLVRDGWAVSGPIRPTCVMRWLSRLPNDWPEMSYAASGGLMVFVADPSSIDAGPALNSENYRAEYARPHTSDAAHIGAPPDAVTSASARKTFHGQAG